MSKPVLQNHLYEPRVLYVNSHFKCVWGPYFSSDPIFFSFKCTKSHPIEGVAFGLHSQLIIFLILWSSSLARMGDEESYSWLANPELIDDDPNFAKWRF